MLPLLLAASSAFAQSTIVDNEVIGLASINPNGVGAPTVIYDTVNQRFLMLYETKSPNVRGSCTEGYHIKYAWSNNGTYWRLSNAALYGAFTLGTCGARHPTMVQQADGTIRVFMAAMGVDGSVKGVTTTWDGISDPRQTVKQFIPALDGIDQPAAVRIDGEYHVLGITANGLVDATSTDLVNWNVSAPLPVNTAWSASGVFSPSASCFDDPQYELNLHFGGWNATQSAWGWGIGSTTGQLFVSSPFDQWTVANDAWVSFDTLDTGNTVSVYYEYLGTDGLPRIGLASNGIGRPSLATLVSRDCTTGP